MPPRRTTRRAAAAAAASNSQQSTLTFHGKPNKITKNTSPRHGKATKTDPALLDDLASTKVDATAAPEPDEPTTAEKALAQQAHAEAPAAADPLADGSENVKAEDVLGGRAEAGDEGAVGGGAAGAGAGWVGDEALRARKLSDAQIKLYWRQKEKERKAPRVHQEGLSVYEKVLREWDMSGQYGPCIGIARLKRWKRANLLGLQPPLEVLAVLLKEMDSGDVKAQRAHVDELMSSHFIET